MLAECVRSVSTQSLLPSAHLVHVDHARVGEADGINRLARASSAAWFAVLADDDLVDATHLETLASRIDDADIVYTWCRVTGRNWNPNALFDAERLRRQNYIPATALIRASLWHRLGGYRNCHGEDWDFWLRALDAGARFVCIPEVTWTYRFHDSNQTYRWHPEIAPRRPP
jgi:GT2 family glycosyltransferase